MLECTEAMVDTRPDLRSFFDNYARVSLHGEPDVLATLYGPTFIVAGPEGSRAFANDDQFTRWIEQVQTANQQSGMQALDVVAVDPIVLSPKHVLAQVQWGARFAKTGSERIEFRIAYLLERAGETWVILGYVSEADQQAEMARHGLT